jgi:lambda family phage portal protein
MTKPHYKLKLRDGGGLKVGAEAFQAASQSHPDLRRWFPFQGSADADLLPEQGRIVARSRDLDRNHGVAGGARQTHLDNIVGCGLRLSAKPNWKVLQKDREWAEEWGNNIEAWWQTWWGTHLCDAAETLTGDGLARQTFNAAWMNGEALSLPLWLPERGYRFSTCLQNVEADRLSNPNGRPNSDTLRGGREINQYGKPLAYWIRTTHPGDTFFFSRSLVQTGGIGKWERIPAETPWGRKRVIHLYDQERTAQSRGIPALASVMRQFKVLGDFTNAELKAAAANALVALVLESSLDQEAVVNLLSSDADALKKYTDGLSSNNRSAIDYQGAMLLPVPLGTKVNSVSPGRPTGAFEPFVTTLFRHIAAGLNIPYELLMKDFSKTNYSSARAALNEAWRFFKGRRNWLATYFYKPVYALWLEEAVNAGIVEAPDFYENWEAYCRCFWIGDGRGYVDPLKEQQASRGRMEDNTSTLELECAEQGHDWEEITEQRARELKRIKELETQYGIKFPTPAKGSAPAQSGDNAAEEGNPPGDGDSGGDKPARQPSATELLEAALNRPSQPITLYHGRPPTKWRFSTNEAGETIAEPLAEAAA